MEFLNKVEIRGVVGNVSVTDVLGRKLARLAVAVATQHAYKDAEGTPVIDVEWHNVRAWDGENIAPLEDLQKGDAVLIEGRLRYARVTNAEGVTYSAAEIIANKLLIIKGI